MYNTSSSESESAGAVPARHESSSSSESAGAGPGESEDRSADTVGSAGPSGMQTISDTPISPSPTSQYTQLSSGLIQDRSNPTETGYSRAQHKHKGSKGGGPDVTPDPVYSEPYEYKGITQTDINNLRLKAYKEAMSSGRSSKSRPIIKQGAISPGNILLKPVESSLTTGSRAPIGRIAGRTNSLPPIKKRIIEDIINFILEPNEVEIDKTIDEFLRKIGDGKVTEENENIKIYLRKKMKAYIDTINKLYNEANKPNPETEPKLGRRLIQTFSNDPEYNLLYKDDFLKTSCKYHYGLHKVDDNYYLVSFNSDSNLHDYVRKKGLHLCAFIEFYKDTDEKAFCHNFDKKKLVGYQKSLYNFFEIGENEFKKLNIFIYSYDQYLEKQAKGKERPVNFNKLSDDTNFDKPINITLDIDEVKKLKYHTIIRLSKKFINMPLYFGNICRNNNFIEFINQFESNKEKIIKKNINSEAEKQIKDISRFYGKPLNYYNKEDERYAIATTTDATTTDMILVIDLLRTRTQTSTI